MAARLSLVLSESNVNIINNTSVVTAKLYYYGNGASYNYNNPKGTITIDGTSYSFNHDFTKSTSAQLLATKSKTVTHNADGSKTVSVSAKFKTGVSLGTLSASATLELTTIPRVSTLTLDVDTVLADGESEVIATATKQSSSFTDILTVSLGDYSQEVESGVAFTIPEEWISAISGESATAKVKVETFNGTTSIGTKTADLTVNVPGSVVPVINDLNISEAVAAVTNAFGNRFVQNLSQLNISVDAEGVYGSTIKSYSIALDGVNYIQQAFTSNVIKTAGTLDIKVKVTDSRGRTTEDTFQVDIIEYVRPAITSMAYVHCDSDGSQNSNGNSTKVTIAGKVYSVEEQNIKALKLKYKTTADEVYTERVVVLSDWTFNVDVIISDTDPTVTYEYIAELTDKINVDSPETFRVTTGIVVISRKAGGTGVTFFGEAEEDGFIIKGKNPLLFKETEALEATKQHLGIGRVEDSGWIEATLEDPFVAYAENNEPCYRKVGNMVEIVGVVKPTATITSNATQHTIFTLPEGYRPVMNHSVVCQGSTMAVWLLTISAATGDVTLSRYRLGDAYANIGTTVWLPFQATFFASEGDEEETTLTATHDGAGNVTAYGITATHDGAGNVRIV